ncbi:MAG: hypothetical protein ACR2M1_12080 [Gemmatimonadaceae bacterium]
MIDVAAGRVRRVATHVRPSGQVIELRHRPHQTTARVKVEDLVIEAAVDVMDAPAVGTTVGLVVDPRRASMFPGDQM